MSGKSIRKKRRICIACGGSAGHIFPGLTLAEELIRHYGEEVEISFLTSDNKTGQSLLAESGFNFYMLPLKGAKLNSVRESLDFISGLFRGTLESIKRIFLSRPDCFVGFGAYIAGPPFAASSLLGVPTLIHEQNVVMGRSNRIMRPFATKVALSFPEEVKSKRQNTVVTGNPVRESATRVQDKERAKGFLGMSHDKFTILIMGGSLGSQAINSLAIEMFKDMDKQLSEKIQAIHISGDRDYARTEKAYRDIDILYKLYPFFKDMSTIYSAADIAISRAGSSAIFELCAHKIPSILIPYPFAGGHQLHNSSYLTRRGAAIMIKEDELSKTTLRQTIVRLMENESLKCSMSREMGVLASPNAAKRLADEVGALIGL